MYIVVWVSFENSNYKPNRNDELSEKENSKQYKSFQLSIICIDF